jgi:hypothetical protein
MHTATVEQKDLKTLNSHLRFLLSLDVRHSQYSTCRLYLSRSLPGLLSSARAGHDHDIEEMGII